MKQSSNLNYRQHLRDERSHMEGLLNQRFNFFIVVFGLVVAAIPNVNNATQLKFIFIVSFIIELMFTLLIGRAQRRLGINMKLMYEFKDDPSTEIRDQANKGSKLNPFTHSVVPLMGYYIPIIITSLLFISIFWANDIFVYFK